MFLKLSLIYVVKETNERFHRNNRRRFKSSVDPRQQKAAAATIVIFMLVVLVAMTYSYGGKNDNIQQQEMVTEKKSFVPVASTSTKDTKKEKTKIRDYGTCTIPPAQIPDHPIQSTFTASYPGSGAKMTWKLIEGMTGLGM